MGIDITKLEQYLSDDEFKQCFDGKTKSEFYAISKMEQFRTKRNEITCWIILK